MNVCTICGSLLEPAWSFCFSCGVIADATGREVVECGKHPLKEAAGFCVVCSRPVCDECEEIVDGKILCADPEHREILRKWSIVGRPESEFEAESIVRNLNHGGIDAKTFSLHDHVEARWMSEQRVLVFVRQSEHGTAEALLHDLGLLSTS